MRLDSVDPAYDSGNCHFGQPHLINFRETTLEGSFSAVSTPIFVSKYLFCRVFRDLKDLHSFAPFSVRDGKTLETHLEDLPNAAAFAAKAARQNQGAEKWKRENIRLWEKSGSARTMTE